MIKVKVKFTGGAFNDQTNPIIMQEFANAMDISLLLGETEVAKNTPVNLGILKGGIIGKRITPFLGQIGVTGPAARYAPFVEDGRKPGRFPPIDAIRLWVKRKLRPPEKQLKSVAYLVGRKIAKKGTPAYKMFARAERAIKVQVVRNFVNAAERIGRRLS